MATDLATPHPPRGGRAACGSTCWRARRRSRRGRSGSRSCVPVVLLALVGPFVAPKSPTAFVGLPFAGPSSDAWLGTDGIGRDVLSRVLVGRPRDPGAGRARDGHRHRGRHRRSASPPATSRAPGRRGDHAHAGCGAGLPADHPGAAPVSIIGPELWLVCLAVAAIHAPQVARVARAATLRTASRTTSSTPRRSDPPAQGDAGRDRAEHHQPGDGRGGPAVDLLDRHHRVAQLPRLRPPAAGADWGLMVNENRIGIQQNPGLWSRRSS